MSGEFFIRFIYYIFDVMIVVEEIHVNKLANYNLIHVWIIVMLQVLLCMRLIMKKMNVFIRYSVVKR